MEQRIQRPTDYFGSCLPIGADTAPAGERSAFSCAHKAFRMPYWLWTLSSLVFLPAAGYRSGTTVNNVGLNGNYWSSSPYSTATHAYNVNFNSGGVNPQNNNNRFNGFSVRLARVSFRLPFRLPMTVPFK